jgi:hypothetical protein
MKTVILFGGGNDGGLVVTDSGARAIRPFEKAIRLNLRAASAMVNAVSAARDDSISKKLSKLAASVAGLAVQQVEDIVGPLDADRAVIFQEDDGGFTCGSTGKPPVPLPWPPREIPTVPDVLAAGVIEPDLVDLLRRARENQIKLTEVFEKPVNIAKRLGVTLSNKSATDLRAMAPSELRNVKDRTDREIIGFFHKVVEDGRYLETWFNRPYEVARTLKVTVSEAALERLLSGGAAAAFAQQSGQVPTEIKVGIVWVVVCIAVGIAFGNKSRAIDDIINDRSGIDKF